MKNKDNLKNIEFLDSIDDRKNRIFNIVYLVLAFWFVLTPFTSTLFDMINSPIELVTQGVMISIFFGVVWLVEFSLKITKLKLKKLTLFEYLGLALVVLFVLQIFINSAYGIGGVLFYTSYILNFCLILKVDKKYYKMLMYAFIIELSIDSILGIIDCKNEIIPGFSGLAYSLQFVNPNYSACVVLGAILICLFYFVKEHKLVDKLVSGICFIILNIFLFINGCFAVEFSLFAAELVLIIYYWIKDKKFPLWFFIAFIVTFVASFFRAHGYSSSNTVFVIELLGRIDVKLGTNFMGSILNFIETLSSGSKEVLVGNVASIDSANKSQQIIVALKENPKDYFSRAMVMDRALNTIKSSAGAFWFGKGAGYADAATWMRVHNIFVLIWLEFGFIFLLLFISLFVSLLVMFIKSKNKSKHIIHLVMMFAYLLSYYFGLMDCSFSFFLMHVAILYKMLKDESKENTVKINDENKKS